MLTRLVPQRMGIGDPYCDTLYRSEFIAGWSNALTNGVACPAIVFSFLSSLCTCAREMPHNYNIE